MTVKAPMHPCPVAGCGRRCSEQFLMCRSDWWRVSQPTRQLVYDTFAAHQHLIGNPRQNGKTIASRAYIDARDQAIAEAEASRQRALANATHDDDGMC